MKFIQILKARVFARANSIKLILTFSWSPKFDIYFISTKIFTSQFQEMKKLFKKSCKTRESLTIGKNLCLMLVTM